MDRLTEREATQMYLDILHQHTAREEEAYLAAIRANVKQKWSSTVQFIEDTRRQINANPEKESICV
jgi:hypothetical protein